MRESFGMKQNVLLYHDVDREETLSIRQDSNNYSFVSYQCVGTGDGGPGKKCFFFTIWILCLSS